MDAGSARIRTSIRCFIIKPMERDQILSNITLNLGVSRGIPIHARSGIIWGMSVDLHQRRSLSRCKVTKWEFVSVQSRSTQPNSEKVNMTGKGEGKHEGKHEGKLEGKMEGKLEGKMEGKGER
jgi:hypothetical protein